MRFAGVAVSGWFAFSRSASRGQQQCFSRRLQLTATFPRCHRAANFCCSAVPPTKPDDDSSVQSRARAKLVAASEEDSDEARVVRDKLVADQAWLLDLLDEPGTVHEHAGANQGSDVTDRHTGAELAGDGQNVAPSSNRKPRKVGTWRVADSAACAACMALPHSNSCTLQQHCPLSHDYFCLFALAV